MSKRIFLICPVRKADAEQQAAIAKYVSRLEAAGDAVHWPQRDTDQEDPTGLRICRDNVGAISEADEVHIWFDPSSQGTLFDLGAAFALQKPVTVANTIEPTQGKSFANMILAWSRG